jgi:hypothetical protein
MSDLVSAWRALVAAKGTTAIAVLTLALGGPKKAHQHEEDARQNQAASMVNTAWMRAAVVAVLAVPAAIVPSVSATQPADYFGIYGYVRRVVLEPDAVNPTRIQVWGTFSVTVAGTALEYHAPERGYLYFELPPDGHDAARAEWEELQRLAETGGPWTNERGMPMPYGITGFGSRTLTPRVRASDEMPAKPDRYSAGRGVVKVSYGPEPSAVKMLGDLPMARSRMNYAVIDKVVLDRAPERIQIWGTFSMGAADGYSFAPPRRGYLYLAPDSGSAARGEGSQWMRTARTGVIAFFTFNPPDYTVRVRPPDESPREPDPYAISLGRAPIRPDTPYMPIRALR